MNTTICSCGASMLWAKTKNNKNIPLDAEPEKRFVFLPERPEGVADMVDTYMPHHATCPEADKYRKDKT